LLRFGEEVGVYDRVGVLAFLKQEFKFSPPDDVLDDVTDPPAVMREQLGLALTKKFRALIDEDNTLNYVLRRAKLLNQVEPLTELINQRADLFGFKTQDAIRRFVFQQLNAICERRGINLRHYA